MMSKYKPGDLVLADNSVLEITNISSTLFNKPTYNFKHVINTHKGLSFMIAATVDTFDQGCYEFTLNNALRMRLKDKLSAEAYEYVVKMLTK